MWFIYALLAALSHATRDVFAKKVLDKGIDEYLVSWGLRFLALPFLLPLALATKIPPIGGKFFTALLVSGSLQFLATIFYMKSLKRADISLAIPMISFTPLFLLVTSPLIIGEFPTNLGVIGIILIVVGSYALNIDLRHVGYLEPFKALVVKKGTRFMLLVAFIWSVSANFDKIGIKDSSAIFWSLANNAFMAFFFSYIIFRQKDTTISKVKNNFISLLPVGFLSAATFLFSALAIKLTLVSYALSIKRTQILISVLLGYFIFKEKGIKERLAGAVIMVIGVVLIAMS